MAIVLRKNNELFTYGDYMTWPDEERWELIDGVPYDMTPTPNRYHQDISGTLLTEIAQFLKDKKCQVYAAPFDIRFPEANQNEDETLTVVQPDISVICDRSKLDSKGCKGAPDWIIEILSPATSKKDRVIKFYTYERFGVKEYWLVSPDDKTVEVFILGENGKYGRPEYYTEEKIIPCFTLEGLSINLAEIFVEE
ncbi:MAG: Uma2 family endonuclease [Candidatus Aminicenantes bacterium]|nr:Uma2 family endonuclease [Candidatus Aminicenantes bacterium]